MISYCGLDGVFVVLVVVFTTAMIMMNRIVSVTCRS